MNKNEIKDNVYIVSFGDFDMGMGIIKIKALPIKDEDNESLINNILNELTLFSTNMNANIELRFQNENSKIYLYIILRIYGREVGTLVSEGILKINELLISSEIDTEVISGEEFYKILIKCPNKKTGILFKEPEIELANTIITEFYYSINPTIIEDSYEFFKYIISIVNDYLYSSISISVTPTFLNERSNDTISYLYNALSTLSNGFDDQYYGRIIDYSAQKHADNYVRFIHKKMFYKMTIYVSAQTITPINQLTSYMYRFNKWNYFLVDVTEWSNYINFPFIMEKEIKDKLMITDFWSYENSPKVLFDLQFMFTLDEINKIFTINNLKDRTIKGVQISRNSSIVGVIDEKLKNKDIVIGHTIDNKEISLSLDDICKHIFVTGVPGSGKTVFMQSILYQLYKKGINFLVLEPAKKEYRALKNIIPELEVFTPGNNNCIPFIINPFIPPKGISLQMYRPSLISALEVAFDMESTLKRLFGDTINACYIKHGWRDTSTSDDKEVIKFGLYEFLQEFEIEMEGKYDRETRERIRTAGFMRIKNILNMDSVLFDTVNSITIDELMSKPTVLELNAIEDNEQKKLIMTLLFTSLFAYIKVIDDINYGHLNHLLLIEEAHVLLKENKFEEQSLGQELVSRILKEKRASGYAIAIADQSPKNVSYDVTVQTGTKIAFRTVAFEDREVLGRAMAMSDDEIEKLTTLKPGEMNFFNEHTDNSLMLKTDNLRERYNIKDTLSDNDILNMSKYWEVNYEKSRPYNECGYIPTCMNTKCDLPIRLEAKYLTERFYLNYFSGKNMDINLFFNGLKIVDRVLHEYINSGKFNENFIILSNCVKCQLIRKVHLETSLKIPLNKRIELMNNRTLIKEK